jgi:hypothetical protein
MARLRSAILLIVLRVSAPSKGGRQCPVRGVRHPCHPGIVPLIARKADFGKCPLNARNRRITMTEPPISSGAILSEIVRYDDVAASTGSAAANGARIPADQHF